MSIFEATTMSYVYFVYFCLTGIIIYSVGFPYNILFMYLWYKQHITAGGQSGWPMLVGISR